MLASYKVTKKCAQEGEHSAALLLGQNLRGPYRQKMTKKVFTFNEVSISNGCFVEFYSWAMSVEGV